MQGDVSMGGNHSGPDQAPPTWPEAAHLCNSWSWPGPPLEACLNSGFRVRLLPFWVLHVEKLIKPGRVKESHPDEHVGMACFTGDCASFSPSLRKAGSRLVSTALTLTFRGAHCPLPPVHVSQHTAAPIRVHRGRQQVAAGAVASLAAHAAPERRLPQSNQHSVMSPRDTGTEAGCLWKTPLCARRLPKLL